MSLQLNAFFFFKTADLEFSHTIVLKIYTEWCAKQQQKTINGLVDEQVKKKKAGLPQLCTETLTERLSVGQCLAYQNAVY